uniref:Isotocin n=1 Tax=Cyprinus carpio TaxID=7962 RepID=ISOT_CYPCA|nr:RecName: Full=Isotocin [Cyprinus carpio]prf//620022A isotocin [Trisopterus luscus]prf//681068A isotocin [Gadus morhua]prf//690928A isotocin [Oncorhynchus tshawytscha]prf//701183A isotocin [Polypterus bichir]prf//650767A isotocin [Cyprinus carpio]
CYISNCPIG